MHAAPSSETLAAITKLRSMLLAEIGKERAADVLYVMLADALPKEVIRDLAQKLDRYADELERLERHHK